ncbi:6653_t:CDS:2, partial [Dentiscutata heterogama]
FKNSIQLFVRLAYRNNCGVALTHFEVPPKIIGKRKPSAYDFDESMGESKSPPSSPRMASHSTQEMEKEYSLVKRTKMSNEKEFPLSKLL